MNLKLKKRLTGAVVIVGVALLFFALIIDDPESDAPASSASGEIETRVFTVKIGDDTRVDKVADSRLIASEAAAASGEMNESKASVVQAGVSEEQKRAAEKPAQKPSAPQSKPSSAPDKKSQPKPAPVATQETGGPWDVQVGSYTSAESAESVRDRLRKSGHPAFIMAVTINGKRWWRVRVGPLKSRAQADALAAEISRDFSVSARVMVAG